MTLTIAEHEREGILVVDPDGELKQGEEDLLLRAAFERYQREARVRVILNCRRLGSVDSTGLGTLVLCSGKLRHAGGKLVLLNLSRTHIELLLLSKLETVFEVFADEQDAVDSFYPNRAIRHFDILEFVQHENHEPGS